ncbi:hypothetical protein PSEUDO8Z_90103 [Pseudomonas sp. 8Z]|nr:hypothetical protein PSEUDO8Z_90103 [Pseudomonas sp. 8Z]
MARLPCASVGELFVNQVNHVLDGASSIVCIGAVIEHFEQIVN